MQHQDMHNFIKYSLYPIADTIHYKIPVYLHFNANEVKDLIFQPFKTPLSEYLNKQPNIIRIIFENIIFATNNMRGFFSNLKHIKEIIIINCDASFVQNMSYLFFDCPNLTKVYMSNLDVSNVTDMSHLFHKCPKLTVLNISFWKTSKLTITSFMFYGCESLYDLDLSRLDFSNVTNIGYMFYNCSGMHYLKLPSIDHIPNAKELFTGCSF